MWKPEKKTLFALMTIMAIMGGLTTYWIDWTVFESKKGIFRELQLPIIFLALGFYFMVHYVSRLKEDEQDD